MKKLPKTIYVTLETESDGTSYLLATENINDVDVQKSTGIYVLQKQGTVKNTGNQFVEDKK